MSTPVGVALLIDTLERGGAERVLVDIANHLDRSRFRVAVVTTRSPGALAASLAPDVPLIALDRRHRLELGAIRRFARLMEAHELRLVHSHSHTAAYFACLARPLAKRRWAHVMHEHHGPIGSAALLRLADRLFLRSVDHLFAVSEPLLAYARQGIGIAASRSELLPNAVRAAERTVVMVDGSPVIVQVARLSQPKDQETAVRTAALLRPAHPALRWLFVGRAEGAYAARVRQLAVELGVLETVEFLGERADVGTIVQGAQIGVLTSRSEGLPLALLEYMGAGLPVVVTDVGDCGAVVRESGGGKVVPAADPERLAEALAVLLKDADARAQAGARNAAFVKARYGLTGMIGRIEAVYDRLLRGPALDPRNAQRGTSSSTTTY